MKQIIFREKDWDRLEHYLMRRKDVESGSYAIFKTSICSATTKLLVRQVFIPDDSDYFKRSALAVAFTAEFTEKILRQCEIINTHLLDIHTHPWSTEVQFSPIDDNEARFTKIPYLEKYLPETIIAFIVFGGSPVIVKARFWDKATNRLSDIDRIVVI